MIPAPERIREYEGLPEEILISRIAALRDRYKDNVCVLAHLYQRRSISQLANFVGDSYGLSRSAANFKGGEYIVFCGVRFMAESAAILCRSDQHVLHPEPEAGCPMADMASIEETSRAWSALTRTGGTLVPVTYMNSTADIKSFCGELGGTICTSSNALKTFEWAFKRGERVFFLPDEHLGRNTAKQFGIVPDDIATWDPNKPDGGGEDYESAKVILWRGYCPVHQKFTSRDVEHIRRFYPDAKVVVHPECPQEVVDRADAVGSTDFIGKFVATTKPGDKIFIGTEINLVQNLQTQYPDRLIAKLHRSLCLTMYQISLARLLLTLENLEAFDRVVVPNKTAHFARVALDRMLSIH
ncbi:MAG: quinolinate synthase NadA [Deltaproteobacteria bacterium]|nr:quinolinate synthase NadA [Deltaproteobacteria bacterium]MBI3293140.1 quinolinate synthase NadA [Deltaproteobacteria bacterium]